MNLVRVFRRINSFWLSFRSLLIRCLVQINIIIYHNYMLFTIFFVAFNTQLCYSLNSLPPFPGFYPCLPSTTCNLFAWNHWGANSSAPPLPAFTSSSSFNALLFLPSSARTNVTVKLPGPEFSRRTLRGRNFMICLVTICCYMWLRNRLPE